MTFGPLPAGAAAGGFQPARGAQTPSSPHGILGGLIGRAAAVSPAQTGVPPTGVPGSGVPPTGVRPSGSPAAGGFQPARGAQTPSSPHGILGGLVGWAAAVSPAQTGVPPTGVPGSATSISGRARNLAGTRRRRRARVVPGACDCFALAALLLDYPDDDLVARRAALLAAARALPSGHCADLLTEFCVWFAQADPDALCVEYVRTFDYKRRNALYMTFASHGDMRRRGEALLAFKTLYRANGFIAREDELPDYLPMVLQFAAQAPQRAAAVALGMARPGIELVARSLTGSGSPWAPVLAAVQGCLPPMDAEGERQLAAVVTDGPPSDNSQHFGASGTTTLQIHASPRQPGGADVRTVHPEGALR